MTEVFVVRDAGQLAEAVAARLVTRIVERQAAAGRACLLVDGDVATAAVLAQLARAGSRGAFDPAQLEVWAADDRAVGVAGTGTWHEVPAGDDPAAAAEAYAASLARARRPEDHGDVPTFDLAVLGLQPDGGVAGLSPESPAVYDARPVVVGGGPAPRVSLGAGALSSADEMWLLGAGPAVAPAAHLALSGAGPLQVPAAAVRGRQRTALFLDEAAASRLPPSLRRLASP